MRGFLAFIAGLTALTACAREGTPSPRYPVLAHQVDMFADDAPAHSPWNPIFGQVAPAPSASSAASAVDPGRWPRLSSGSIPGGSACLDELRRLGVPHTALDSLKGVQTPVDITGPIGPIGMQASAGRPLSLDCRLAVALAWSAPRLAELGVSRMGFSGAYVDRLTRAGRKSLHAAGLAIDVHSMTVDGVELRVKDAFTRGISDGCAPDAPALNRVRCGLDHLGLYKELLTPDYDADHHDHFHLGIAPTGVYPAAAPAPEPVVAAPAPDAAPKSKAKSKASKRSPAEATKLAADAPTKGKRSKGGKAGAASAKREAAKPAAPPPAAPGDEAATARAQVAPRGRGVGASKRAATTTPGRNQAVVTPAAEATATEKTKVARPAGKPKRGAARPGRRNRR